MKPIELLELNKNKNVKITTTNAELYEGILIDFDMYANIKLLDENNTRETYINGNTVGFIEIIN